VTRLTRFFQHMAQAGVLLLVEPQIGVCQANMLRPCTLAGNQRRNVGEVKHRREPLKIGLDFAGAYQMDAGEQGAVYVKQRLHWRGTGTCDQLPLGAPETQVVVVMLAGDARFGNRLQLLMLRRGLQHRRGIEVLENRAVFFEELPAAFLNVVCHQVDDAPLMHGRRLDSVTFGIQANHLLYW
jgi:hypothetical protein